MPPRHPVKPARRSSWPLLVLALAVIGLLAWLLYPREASPPSAQTLPPDDAVAQWGEPDATPRYPLGGPEDATRETVADLPPLGESDAALFDALAQLLDRTQLESLLVPEFVVQRVVVSIDNLPRRSLPARMHPVRPTPGALAVEAGEPPRLAAANHARYEARLSQLEDVGVEPLVDLYVLWYPRFQQAYRELGYPEGHFNDRLVEVIDHLLEAPEPGDSLDLVRTERGYAYADPSLEEASVGHRAMFRIGPQNTARLKDWLRKLRAEVTSRADADAGAAGDVPR